MEEKLKLRLHPGLVVRENRALSLIMLLALKTSFGNVKVVRTRSWREVSIRRGKAQVAASSCKDVHRTAGRSCRPCGAVAILVVMRCVCAGEAAAGATQGVFAAACPACADCAACGLARDAGAVMRRVPLRACRCGQLQSTLLRETTEDKGGDGCGAGGANRDTAAAKCGWQDAARAADGHGDGVPE